MIVYTILIQWPPPNSTHLWKASQRALRRTVLLSEAFAKPISIGYLVYWRWIVTIILSLRGDFLSFVRQFALRRDGWSLSSSHGKSCCVSANTTPATFRSIALHRGTVAKLCYPRFLWCSHLVTVMLSLRGDLRSFVRSLARSFVCSFVH